MQKTRRHGRTRSRVAVSYTGPSAAMRKNETESRGKNTHNHVHMRTAEDRGYPISDSCTHGRKLLQQEAVKYMVVDSCRAAMGGT